VSGPPAVSEHPATVVARIEARASRLATPVDGGSLVWRVWGAGRPLVLLHGASGSWTHWIRNVLPLAERFRLLVPDMPGFGDSDMPSGPMTADVLAEHLAAGLDVLEPPPAGLDVAGFSFGAIVAGIMAARLGARVRRLILLGAGGLGLPAATPREIRALAPGMSAADVESVHRDNLGTLMLSGPAAVDDLAVFVQMASVRRARFKSGRIPMSNVLLTALPGVRARISWIWAGRDAFTGEGPERVEMQRRLLAPVQPDLDFRLIEDSGHWTPYEAASRVNATLLEILSAPSP